MAEATTNNGRWLDLKGPIVRNTVYFDNVLVAKDCSLTLPAVTNQSADFPVMGNMTLPVPGAIEPMEFSITKVGIDYALRAMNKQDFIDIEVRFVQDVKDSDGRAKREGCKAFMKAMPKQIMPAISQEIGSKSENELVYDVIRYQLFAGGEEVICVDRMADIVRLDGLDLTEETNSMLYN